MDCGGKSDATPVSREEVFLVRNHEMKQFARMTRDQILTAIREGIPFAIRMADGEKYEVVDQHKVAVGRTNVIVVGSDDMPHILPMLTMTGISYLKSRK